MIDRPAFVEVPVPGGGSMTAVVANRDGVTIVEVNGVPHAALVLSVNSASATISIMTDSEIERIIDQLEIIRALAADERTMKGL